MTGPARQGPENRQAGTAGLFDHRPTQAGNRDERSKGRDQALHGEILENALIAPEYTGHPAACLCDGAPVRRGYVVRGFIPVRLRSSRKHSRLTLNCWGCCATQRG
jgi:hypothetical protein